MARVNRRPSPPRAPVSSSSLVAGIGRVGRSDTQVHSPYHFSLLPTLFTIRGMFDLPIVPTCLRRQRCSGVASAVGVPPRRVLPGGGNALLAGQLAPRVDRALLATPLFSSGFGTNSYPTSIMRWRMVDPFLQSSSHVLKSPVALRRISSRVTASGCRSRSTTSASSALSGAWPVSTIASHASVFGGASDGLFQSIGSARLGDPLRSIARAARVTKPGLRCVCL